MALALPGAPARSGLARAVPQRRTLTQSRRLAVAATAAPVKKAYAASDPRYWWSIKQRSSSDASSGNGDNDNSSSPGAGAQPTVTWQHGGLAPPPADLPAAVAPLAAACGGADAAKLARAMACLPPAMRQRVLQHGPAVAAHLRALDGAEPATLSAVLQRCLLPLFSQPPEAHGAVLVGQLMAVGLSADQALACLAACASAASCADLRPAMQAVAALLEADASGPEPSIPQQQQQQQQGGLAAVASLLRAQPEAAALLAASPAELRRRAAYLEARLGLGGAALAVALRRDALLLSMPPEQLGEQAAALEEGLGLSLPQFAQLAAAAPAVLADLGGCVEELEHAAGALAGEFGRDTAASMALRAPQLLATERRVWRRSLAALRLLWVGQPGALAERRPRLLCEDLSAPAAVATRLLLQCTYGLSAAAVYQLLPGAAAASGAAARLAARLAYMQQRGLPLPPVEAAAADDDSAAALASTRGPSLVDLAEQPDERLLPRLQALAAASGRPWPASAAELRALPARMASHPAWQHLLAEAGAESARLQRLLSLA